MHGTITFESLQAWRSNLGLCRVPSRARLWRVSYRLCCGDDAGVAGSSVAGNPWRLPIRLGARRDGDGGQPHSAQQLLFLIARYVLADALHALLIPSLIALRRSSKRSRQLFADDPPSPIVRRSSLRISRPPSSARRLRTFIWTTTLGILIPGVLAYTWISAGLGAALDAGQAPDLGSLRPRIGAGVH